MAIAASYPTIKPSLLLDFINTKAVDPRVTFTRSTSGTYYDGVTSAKAEENLLINSVGPLNSGWSDVGGYAGTQGSELITNGDFATDLSGWTASGAGWTWDAGPPTAAKATNTTDTLTQTIGSAGSPKAFFIQWTQTIISGTRLRVRLRNFANNADIGPFAYYIGSGTFGLVVFSTDSGATIQFIPEAPEVLTVDDVSIKELTADNVTAPDGTATAVTATADAANATFTQSVTATAADYTFSVYLRRVTGTGDIDIQCGGGTWVTQSITSSWARYDVTQTLTAGTRTPGIRIVTSGDQIEIWGAQLEQRSAETAYTPTTTQPITNYIPALQTAAAGVPRIDHDPVTGECLGLLMESQRTNLLTYSEQFDDAAWTKTASTVTANTVIAPDGTLTGEKFIPAASGTPRLSQTIAFASTTYTAGVFVKISDLTAIAGVNFTLAGTAGANGTINIVNGSVIGSGAAFVSGNSKSVGNGWYFVYATISNTFVGSSSLRIEFRDGSNNIVLGNDFTGIFVWGAQLEAGAFPTSYIPTTSASVTRTADYVEAFGDQLTRWFSPVDATFFMDWVTQGESLSTSGSTPVGLGHPTNNDMFMGLLMYDNRTTVGFTSPSAGSYKQNMTGQRVKGAVSYSSLLFGGSGIDSALDGTVYAGGGASITNNPTILTRLRFMCGARSVSEQHRLPGWLRKIAYYPKRLTNANLQALTA